jgi:hypothetical protein
MQLSLNIKSPHHCHFAKQNAFGFRKVAKLWDSAHDGLPRERLLVQGSRHQ